MTALKIVYVLVGELTVICKLPCTEIYGSVFSGGGKDTVRKILFCHDCFPLQKEFCNTNVSLFENSDNRFILEKMLTKL